MAAASGERLRQDEIISAGIGVVVAERERLRYGRGAISEKQRARRADRFPKDGNVRPCERKENGKKFSKNFYKQADVCLFYVI